MFTKTAPIKPAKKNSHNPAFFGQERGNASFIPSVQTKLEASKLQQTNTFIPAVQPKLTISLPDDKYEVEADTIADSVVSKLDKTDTSSAVETTAAPNSMRVSSKKNTGNVQAKCSACEREEKLQKKEEEKTENDSEIHDQFNSGQPNEHPNSNQHIQAKAEGTPIVSGNLQSRLKSNKGGGSPMSRDTQDSMGAAFGAAFGNIRIHTDSEALQMSKELHAQAFTHGNDIYFNHGKYDPDSTNGKHLLAHELTHTLQQTGGNLVQRACDPTIVGPRNTPVFFPHEANIIRVFEARATLRKWGGRRDAVGLVQQALVDIGYDLGTFGPNGDGVDRMFGPVTEAAVINFQQAEGISAPARGVIDSLTLKCIDETRSKLTVQAHQSGMVSEDQYQVGGEVTEGQENSIYFARGLSILDTGDKVKITRLLERETDPIKGCNVTLKGFISEDELAIFGPTLAADRINTVDSELVLQQHNSSGGDCAVPPVPVRTHLPLPDQSAGVSDYTHRRKVEILLDSQASSTPSCTATSPQVRSLTPTENTDLATYITMSSDWIDEALRKLVPGNAEGDAALTAYFGASANRTTITANLTTWRDHILNVIPVQNQSGTECNDTCRIALAFNNGTGASAMMTMCPPLFTGQIDSIHPGLDENQSKSFVIMHEAGHGSIGTKDTAYGHRRLIEFIDEYPSLAENNTDSYTLMILCLNGFSALCTAPVTQDTYEGLANSTEEESSRRGISWLQTWIGWSSQDLSGVYRYINRARETGDALSDIHTYYAETFDLLIDGFGIRRPAGDPSPTFGEQTLVAAIFNRFQVMKDALTPGLRVEKDTSASANSRWLPGPGRTLFLEQSYFGINNDRARVETLLPLLLRAMTSIASSMEVKYETLTKAIVQLHWGNHP